MIRYKYKALKDNNEEVSGEIEAADVRQARERIRALGYIPTKIYCDEFQEIKQKPVLKRSSITNLSLNDKILFTTGLQDLLSSGIPIADALNILKSNNKNSKIKTICNELQKAIYTGMTFSTALEYLFKGIFDDVYIGLVRSGETSGELDTTLERILVLLKKQEYIKGKIRRDSIYPGFLCFLIMCLPVWGAFVYPRFSYVFGAYSEDMPQIAKTFFGTLEFFYNYWWLAALIVFAFVGGCILLFKNPVFKAKWDAFLLKLPAISDFVKYLNLANYMTVLFISYEAGVTLPSGMELANKTVHNLFIKSRLKQASSLARQGNTLAKSYEHVNILPAAVYSLISTGEMAGTLGKTFRDISVSIDKKLDNSLNVMLRVFKHLATIILAIIIGYAYAAFMFAYMGMMGALL